MINKDFHKSGSDDDINIDEQAIGQAMSNHVLPILEPIGDDITIALMVGRKGVGHTIFSVDSTHAASSGESMKASSKMAEDVAALAMSVAIEQIIVAQPAMDRAEALGVFVGLVSEIMVDEISKRARIKNAMMEAMPPELAEAIKSGKAGMMNMTPDELLKHTGGWRDPKDKE